MRIDRVVRVLVLAFALGGILGLVAGLISGGDVAQEARGDSPTERQSSSAVTAAVTQEGAIPLMTAERARSIGANELGQVMVLEYHKVGTPEGKLTRSPEGLRDDLKLLKAEGYFPVNLRDLAGGNIEVPAGKTPVVLTFDDSSPGQFRLLDDGTLDPDSAVGILQEFSSRGGWAPRASFYVLLDVIPDDHILFGQKGKRREKVQRLVEWGYEVGSHTVTHLNLAKASRQESVKQLAVSKRTIEQLVGGEYQVETVSVPFGAFPKDETILARGQWDGQAYQYIAALAAWGGSAPSPYADKFNPYRIPRIEVSGDVLEDWIETFKKRPELRFVSDGDPAAVSAPDSVASELGKLAPNQGRPVVRY